MRLRMKRTSLTVGSVEVESRRTTHAFDAPLSGQLLGPRALVEGQFFSFQFGSAQISGLGGWGRKKVNQINLRRRRVSSRTTPSQWL